MDDLQDGYVPGSSTTLSTLTALLAGVLLVLAAAWLLHRRSPRTAAAAGLVLLLVAALRPLADAGALLDPRPPGLRVWLVAALLCAGAAAGAALGRTDRPAVPVLAVVLAALPLLAPVGDLGRVDFGEPSPAWLGHARRALTGVLAAGAVVVLRPGPRGTAAAVLGLLLVLAARPLLDGDAVHAVAAGLAVAVLLPLVLRLAAEGLPVPRAGLAAGVAVVLGAVAADGALADRQERHADRTADRGLEVVSNDEHTSLLELRLDPPSPLVPLLPPAQPRTLRLPG